MMAVILDRIVGSFSRISLRAKLTGGFLALIAMIVLLDAVSLLSISHQAKMTWLIECDLRVADLCMLSRDAIFQAQHDEKDFLIHYRDLGVSEAKARYATLLHLHILDIFKNMAEIRSLSQNQEFIRQTEQIEATAQLYQSSFLKVVQLHEELGQGDSGLAGKFRQQAREIEALADHYHSLPIIRALLAMRQTEWNYFSSGQGKYAARLREEIARVREEVFRIGLPPGQAEKVAARLGDYLNLFEQFYAAQVQIDQEIETYRTAVNAMEPMLENLHSQAEQHRASARQAEGQTAWKVLWTAFTVGSAAVFFGLLVALVVYRNISRGVKDCLGFANRLARGDLHARIKREGCDEFATLAAALNDMADSLQGSRDKFS